MVMAGRPRSMENMFNAKIPVGKTKQGDAGFDNIRDNIDPKIITRVILAKTLYGQITLAAQPNITSLGTLTGLNIVSGGKIGMGTTSPTYDIGFDNVSTHKIMNETTTNIVAGKSLELRAGSTINTGTSSGFVDLVAGNKSWRGMAAAPNGNVYACVYGGSIWMQTGGVGAFVDLVAGDKNWNSMAAAPNGDVYACVYGGSIWMQTGTLGTINLSGGNLILSSGKGKGTGVSNVSIFTGTTLASGYTMQTLSEKITVIGNGNMGIGTTTPNEKLQVVGNISTNGNVELATISVAAVPGIDAVIVTAAITGGGAQGSMTFSKGILTAQTPAT